MVGRRVASASRAGQAAEQAVTTLVVLSAIGSALTVINQSAIRKKRWWGWACSIPNILLFMYVQWQAGSWPYTGLGLFYLYNALMGWREWRREHREVRHDLDSLPVT